jgi:hypothetical protein
MISAKIAMAMGPAPRSPKKASMSGGPRNPRLLTVPAVARAPAAATAFRSSIQESANANVKTTLSLSR